MEFIATSSRAMCHGRNLCNHIQFLFDHKSASLILIRSRDGDAADAIADAERRRGRSFALRRWKKSTKNNELPNFGAAASPLVYCLYNKPSSFGHPFARSIYRGFSARIKLLFYEEVRLVLPCQ